MADGAPSPATARRGPSVLLIVSLCLNLVFLGIVVSGIATEVRRQVQAMQTSGVLGATALMKLTPDKQARIKDILDAHHDRLHDLRVDARHARVAAFRTFASPNFNADDYTKALEAVRAADNASEEEWVSVTLESAMALTPAERQQIVKKKAKFDHSWMWHFPGGTK